MGLAFKLRLPRDKNFLLVSEIPALTAKAIHPESEDNSEAQDIARAGCEINHKEALSKAIKASMVTPLNPMSYEQHTFPFGDALQRAVISLDDFKRFASSLQIEVMMWVEPLPAPDTDNVTGTKKYLTIHEAASALAEKYRLDKPAMESLRERMMEAARRGELVVRDSQGFTYTPSPAEIHYYMLERVSADDLNAWFEKQGVEYRLDKPGHEQQSDHAPGKASKVDAKKEKIRAILSKIEAADGEFSRDAMKGRKADFFQLCQTLEHESFAYISQSTFDDYLPGLCKFMPGARETDYYLDIAAKLG